MKKRRQQYYYWDIVNEGDLYEERLSITLFSCIELQYLCYDKGVSARHYDDQVESDDDHDSLGSMVEEEEVVQEERQWDAALISTEEEEEEEVKEKRQWDDLPSTALLNIFCKSELKDRLKSIPLVCKSWKNVTDDPRCWSSMIPDSVSLEDAFIKKRDYTFPYYSPLFNQCIPRIPDYVIGISRLFKEEGDLQMDEEEFQEEEEVSVGLKRLRTLIKKSGGGAAITTLYLQPFFQYWLYDNIDPTCDDDKILHLIANCCPNLKHISFNIVWDPNTSMEAVLRLFNTCKKLELIELFYSRGGFYHRGGEFDDEQALLELLSCLPNYNLRAFRLYGCNSIAVAGIATHLPQLKLLSLKTTSLTSKELSIILVSCLELQYLHVYERYPMLNNCDDILHQASSLIPEFYYEYYESPVLTDTASIPEWYSGYYSDNWSEFTEDELNCFEDDDEYCTIDYYDDILQQRKEKKEHHYILKI